MSHFASSDESSRARRALAGFARALTGPFGRVVALYFYGTGPFGSVVILYPVFVVAFAVGALFLGLFFSHQRMSERVRHTFGRERSGRQNVIVAPVTNTLKESLKTLGFHSTLSTYPRTFPQA